MSKDNKKKKKKKVKTVYIDDGSTISDMSGISDARLHAFGSRPQSKKNYNKDNDKYIGATHTGNKFKDSWRTYFKAVRQMIIPMLVTIAIISVTFLILWILLTIAS